MSKISDNGIEYRYIVDDESAETASELTFLTLCELIHEQIENGTAPANYMAHLVREMVNNAGFCVLDEVIDLDRLPRGLIINRDEVFNADYGDYLGDFLGGAAPFHYVPFAVLCNLFMEKIEKIEKIERGCLESSMSLLVKEMVDDAGLCVLEHVIHIDRLPRDLVITRELYTRPPRVKAMAQS